MKNFIKVWWHCLGQLMGGHAMCKYHYEDHYLDGEKVKYTEWECICGYK